MLRDLAPRVLGALLRRAHDLPTAEDAVQEALLAAFVEWPERGVPDNPGGWLYRTATRRLADMRDSDRARRDREATFGLQRASHTTPPPDADFLDDPMHHDDTLHLLFTCCAPVLAPPSAIALLLRAVGGLTTAEIARAFFVPEATMAQRISRAKQTLAAAGTPFPPPDLRACEPRLAAVLHVLYLIFNEATPAPAAATCSASNSRTKRSASCAPCTPRCPTTAKSLACSRCCC